MTEESFENEVHCNEKKEIKVTLPIDIIDLTSPVNSPRQGRSSEVSFYINLTRGEINKIKIILILIFVYNFI